MNNVAIRLKNVSKIYKLYDSPRDRLKESLSLFGNNYHKEFFAINDLTLDISKGDTVGIIGNNGSGKSTLLQMIAGVLTPSKGTVFVDGKVSALLELGAGFNPEFTGIENVYMQGTLMGFTKSEMSQKIDDILSFADIGEFIHHPVKTYSSGMFVRLAFSVATQIEPEVLIVDEALSVGDMFFQAKCMRKMRQMIDNNGVTLLFVSHDLSSVRALCNKAVLLQNGSLTYYGDASKAADKYFALSVNEKQTIESKTPLVNEINADHTTSQKEPKIYIRSDIDHILSLDKEFEKKSSFQRIQNSRANFHRILLLNEEGSPIQQVEFDQKVVLRMVINACDKIDVLGFGYRIVDKKGISIVGSNSEIEEKNYLNNLRHGSSYVIDWNFTVRLAPGFYSIATTCYIPIDMRNYEVEYCDMIPIAYQFTMNNRKDCDINAISYWDNSLHIQEI